MPTDLYPTMAADFDGPQLTDPACAGIAQPDPIFFPVSDGMTKVALVTCRGCVDRLPCLEWALAHKAEGIWGGTTTKDRGRMMRNKRRNQAA